MRLKRAVTIKTIVTEEFKKDLTEELTKTLSKIDSAAQQLEYQIRRYVPEVAKADIEQAGRIRRELEGERQRHEGIKAEITERMREVSGLKIGDEFVQGNIESDVEVQVGDDLAKKIGAAEVIVKDGIIQEIIEG